jgi:hypothetical protein
MATPPTFVASYTSLYDNSTSPKNVSVTTQAGDVVVVIAAAENGTVNFGTLAGNSIGFTQKQLVHIDAGWCDVAIWTGTDNTGGTNWTLSLTRASQSFGLTCLVFRNSGGIGASNKDNNEPGGGSVTFTTTQDNSAIVVIDADWHALSGSGRVWQTLNSITPTSGNGLERAYFDGSTPGTYTVYGAYYNDAGTAGSKTVGLTSPNTQRYSIAAVEVKGTATAGMPLMWIGM